MMRGRNKFLSEISESLSLSVDRWTDEWRDRAGQGERENYIYRWRNPAQHRGITIPILKVREWRLREVMCVVQGQSVAELGFDPRTV